MAVTVLGRASRVMAAMICSVGLAWPEGAVSLLLTGTFHGDEVKARTGERWLGLFPGAGGFVWRTATITTRRVNDAVVDAEGEKTGIAVTVQGGWPVVLVKGIAGLAAKKVRTILHSPNGLDLPQSEPLELSLGEEGSYRLRIVDRLMGDDAPEKPSRLLLEREGFKQVLYEWPTGLRDQHGRLIWAGDLDGDGKLDLLMVLSDHYNVSEYTLFLSSRSSEGNLVGRVAAFVAKGC